MADENETVTRRVVLKHALVIELPEGTEDVQELVKLLRENKAIKGAKANHAWVELGEADGSKTGAIEAFAGKSGAPDAKPGAYRAPNLRSWKGGAKYDPPVQTVNRSPLD